MIYLIDNGYRMKSALITLVNQVKSPEAYNECLGCKVKDKLGVEAGFNVNFNESGNNNVNDSVNDNVNYDVNENVNDIGNENVTDNVNGFDPQPTADDKGNANGNVNVKANGKQEYPLSDDDDTVWSKARERDEVLGWCNKASPSPTNQRDKPCSQCGFGCGCRRSGLVSPMVSGAPSLKVSRLGTPKIKGLPPLVPHIIYWSMLMEVWKTDRNTTVHASFPKKPQMYNSRS